MDDTTNSMLNEKLASSQQAFAVGRMKVAIRDLMARKPTPTLFDVQMLAGGEGDLAVIFERRNVVLWARLSDDACVALKQMAEDGEMGFAPTDPLVYLCDGAMLKLPLAQVDATTGAMRTYRRAHWLPVMLRPGNALAGQ